MRARLTRALLHPLAKPTLFLLCLLPLAGLIVGAATGRLGANPPKSSSASSANGRCACCG